MTLSEPTSRLDRFIASTARWLISWSKSIVVLTLIATALLAVSAMRTHLDPGGGRKWNGNLPFDV